VKYLALIFGNDEIWNGTTPQSRRELIGAVDAFNERLRDSGELVAVDGLLPRALTI
jgi:hypothetical protein